MEFLMEPQNIALIIGAIAFLVTAIGVAIKQGSVAFKIWVEARSKVTVITAENERQKVEIERLKAEAQTREQDGENERDTKIVNILERQTEQNGNWLAIAERQLKTMQDTNQVNEKVATGLSEMARENKALRISMESWPQAVDGNIEALSKKVEALESAIGQVVEAVEAGNGDHADIRGALDGKVVPLLMDIHNLVQPPPPPPPAEKDKPDNVKPLNADAGDHSAVKLPKTG